MGITPNAVNNIVRQLFANGYSAILPNMYFNIWVKMSFILHMVVAAEDVRSLLALSR